MSCSNLFLFGLGFSDIFLDSTPFLSHTSVIQDVTLYILVLYSFIFYFLSYWNRYLKNLFNPGCADEPKKKFMTCELYFHCLIDGGVITLTTHLKVN